MVSNEELEAVEIESSKTIDIDGFVDAADIDPIYFDNSYYMAPDGPMPRFRRFISTSGCCEVTLKRSALPPNCF